jgi:hypothetical protein
MKHTDLGYYYGCTVVGTCWIYQNTTPLCGHQHHMSRRCPACVMAKAKARASRAADATPPRRCVRVRL